MSHQIKQRELKIDLTSGEFEVSRVEHSIGSGPERLHIVGPVDYGWARTRQNPDVMTWGGGPLAGSRIPGTRRLVFCGWSPAWESFYVSSLGGGAYIMHRLGVDFVSISGRAPQDSVLILNHKQGQISARLEPINADLLWSGYADREGTPLFGFYALQQAVFERYGSEYEGDWLRVFATGPAARRTNEGIIGSNQIRKGRILPIDDWAGRGGLGSRLLQHHRLAACIFGGDWEDPDLKDSKEIDAYFQQYYGNSMMKVDLGAAEKYRYVPGFMTGGTFGVNMHTADDKLFSFNYASIYQTEEARLEQHQHYILAHYLKQFNEEIIQPRNFAHCGEPCSIACKKYDGVYKKDYEPYQALGPQCGIFDQRPAEVLNHYVDALGIDAIQYGGMISWLMELIHSGLLPPADFGLPPADEMRFGFSPPFPPAPPPQGEVEEGSGAGVERPDVVELSQKNGMYAMRIAEMLMFSPQGAIFREGIRVAAAALDQRYTPDAPPGQRMSDRAVFTAHGKKGSMTPNQYWVPGMLSPMPMMGKYFVYYGYDYLPPRLLGRKCIERMVYELFSENSGVCRFHRKWVEAIVDEIISAHYDFPIDYKAHQFKLVRQIYQAEGEKSVFWQSERTIDIVWQYLEKWLELASPPAPLSPSPSPEGEGSDADDARSLADWVAFFRHDKWAAGRAYWDEIRQGIAEALAAGAEAIPDQVAPYQAAKLDIMGRGGS